MPTPPILGTGLLWTLLSSFGISMAFILRANFIDSGTVAKVIKNPSPNMIAQRYIILISIHISFQIFRFAQSMFYTTKYS